MQDVAWGIVAIALTIAVAVLFPLGLIVLAPVLFFGGISARRRSQNLAARAIANGAIVGVIASIALIVVLAIAVGFSFSTTVGSGGGSSIGTVVSAPIQQIPTPVP